MRRLLLPALVLLAALIVRLATFESATESLAPSDASVARDDGAQAIGVLEALTSGSAAARDRVPLAQDEPQSDVARDLPTSTIELDVWVQDSWKEDAERFPGMGFIVGIARSHEHAEGPVGEHKRILAQQKSDADGSARLSLRVPTALLNEWGADARLWGHVAEPGKRAYAKTTGVPAADERAQLKLFPRSGVSLTGRVLRADGTPAHPAKVQLYPASDPEGEYVINEDSAYVDPHGGFQLDADEPGLYDVQVSASGQGSAGVRGVELAASIEPAFLELRLSGDGVIAGVLLDPDGRPVPKYRLWCAPAEHRDQYVGYLHDPQQIPHEWGGGLYGDHGETDELGRFEFEGLCEGEYHLRGHTAKTGYYEELLTDRPVPTGTRDLELRLARHRVLARVLDHEGAVAAIEPHHRPSRDELPPHALYIEECDANGRLLQAERYTHDTRERLANGDIVLDVQPGRSYVLGVFSRECALVEERFDVTPGDYERVITIRLPAPAPSTVLEVELQTPDGEPYDGSNAQRLYSPTSGRLLWESSSYNRDSTARIAVGPGRYRWGADAEPMRGHHGERFEATPYAPVTDELEVFPGKLNRFERRLAGAGRVALLLVSARAPRPAIQPDGAGWDDLPWEEQLRIRAGGARVRFEQAGRVTHPDFGHGFGAHLDVPPPIGTLEAPWVTRGHAVETVAPIVPGHYRVTVELDGLGSRSRDVEVRAGELTEVTISFDD
ncbi:MAG: carboxypeptidase regulatory-like domain-containing protein [Planctomycetes bacterium]|nr:carboxypeptidase regulatory-like domain-containing protein [Planctomycetota bacterium]